MAWVEKFRQVKINYTNCGGKGKVVHTTRTANAVINTDVSCPCCNGSGERKVTQSYKQWVKD